MRKTIFHLVTAMLLTLVGGEAMAQTGTWKAYLSYYDPTEIVEAGDHIIYVLASGGLYSYNRTDQSLQTYDKTTVLNDCGIAHIAWSSKAARLAIVYDNGNIDMLDGSDNVVNIADYMDWNTTLDKTVNSLYVYGAAVYMATNFGIVELNASDATIQNTYQLGFPVNYCYQENGYLYAASSSAGLYRASLSTNMLDTQNWTRVGDYTANTDTVDPDLLALVKTLSPGGPKYNYFGFMRYKYGALYTCGGGFGHGLDLERPGMIQVLSGDSWQIYQDTGISDQTGVSYTDINVVDVDSRDHSRLMAGSRTGLYEFYNGSFSKYYDNSNSPIEPFDGTSKEYQLIIGLTYDNTGNLWVLNSQAPHRCLLEYTSDSEWKYYDFSELMTTSSYGGHSLGSGECAMIDSRGYLWFVNNHWETPALYCYQPTTNTLTSYKTFVNEDGTTVDVTYVTYVAEDNDNNIWVGTNAGVLLLYSSDIASGSTIFTQIKVPRDDGTNYADYLLSGVNISCIAVDKANRKWFGTNGNGVFLIGSDNMSTIHHFTAENSSLLSDNVTSIAINDETDEVFFGTENGLCSYISNANSAAEGMTKNTVWAYPNPVRPGYTGAITITGLEEDADVKIVTVNGTLVEEGRATNGQYKWYGQDKKMKRVASGVYMVEVATSEGEKGVVCKIAVVN